MSDEGEEEEGVLGEYDDSEDEEEGEEEGEGEGNHEPCASISQMPIPRTLGNATC